MLVEQGQDSGNKHSQLERERMEDTQKSLIHSNPKAFERYWLEFFCSVEISLISSQLCNLRGAPKSIFHCAIWLHSLASLPFSLPQSLWLKVGIVSFSCWWKFGCQVWLNVDYFMYTYGEWVKPLSRVQLFVTQWTVAHQAPLSMGFSRQEYWSGLPFPSPGDLLNPGIEPRSPALQADALTSEPPGKLYGTTF